MGNLVLIADDDVDIVRFVALNLRLEGFEVVVASDGQDVDKALDVRPNLILLDTMMPRMDGYEVYRMRHQRPDSAVPVIMLTAKSLEADRAMALHAGADDWVTKPFDPADLVSKVKDHLRAQGVMVGRRGASGPCRGIAGARFELAAVLRLARLHLGPLDQLAGLGGSARTS